MDALIAVIVGAVVGSMIVWGARYRDQAKEPIVYWTDVSIAQLELHHKMTLAMADRVNIDPACRDLLRHQVAVLKSVGVVNQKDTAIEMGELPSALQLEAYGPRENGPILSRPVEGPKIKFSSLDEHNRSRGYRVMGDPDPEEDEDRSFGWGHHQGEE